MFKEENLDFSTDTFPAYFKDVSTKLKMQSLIWL